MVFCLRILLLLCVHAFLTTQLTKSCSKPLSRTQAVATDAQLQAFMAGAVEQASNVALSPLGPPARPPSVVAAACLQAAAARLGIRPAWSATLQKMTGYAEEDVAYAANKIGLAEPLAS